MEEGEFVTQMSGKQFEIGEIKSWEKRAGPPGASFRQPFGRTAWGEDDLKPGQMPCGLPSKGAARKERAHP